MSNIISMSNINKKYIHKKETKIILRNIDFSIEYGEMIAIVGKSGAGKTTLLNLLGLLDQNYDGDFVLLDNKINSLKETEMARIRNKNIGFVLQESALINDLTIRENILLPYYYSNEKISKNIIKEKCITLAKKFDINSLLDKKPKFLSGGQKERAVLARALLMEPDLILADEPTGSLDEENAKIIMDYFYELKELGRTIITVTHDKDVASKHDKTYNLSDGILTQINKE